MSPAFQVRKLRFGNTRCPVIHRAADRRREIARRCLQAIWTQRVRRIRRYRYIPRPRHRLRTLRNVQVEIILGIGIFIFFFLIGLEEIDIRGFVAAIRGRLFLASVLSVLLISMLVSLAVTTDLLIDLELNLSFTQALGLAGVLSLSSLGVVAKVLIDEGRLKETVGVQMFTAVIIAELLALFVVGFAISEHFAAEGTDVNLDLPSIATLLAPNHRIRSCDLALLHLAAAQDHRLSPPIPAGAATIFRTPARRSIPRRCRSRGSRSARFARRTAIRRRALHIALPGPTRHHARHEGHRRRIFRPPLLRICGTAFQPRFPAATSADDTGLGTDTPHRKIRRIVPRRLHRHA